MDDLLGSEAIQELVKVQQQLLLAPHVKVSASARWLKKTLAWCNEHEIHLGRAVTDKVYYIERSGIVAIERWYANNNQGSLTEILQKLDSDRSDMAKMSSDEKLASPLPTQHLVLTACTDLSARLSQQSLFGLTDTPSQVNVELDVKTIDLSTFDYLVVIENRDSFNESHRYQMPATLLNALIIYRGHEKMHSKGAMTLKSRWLKEKGEHGQVYFGDFDLDGLAIPIDSEVDYQHLLFPSLTALSAQLTPFHYDDKNDYRLRNLTHRCPLKWQPLLTLLLTEQKGLRQQWIFEDELTLF